MIEQIQNHVNLMNNNFLSIFVNEQKIDLKLHFFQQLK
jgi:hypothetical protein